MTTGQRIAQKRKELGLSQEALGDRLGVTRQSIYKWESDSRSAGDRKAGGSEPSVRRIRRVAAGCGGTCSGSGWKTVPDGNPAGNEHSGAMGSGEPPPMDRRN